jgi:hypothetical protein
MVSARESGLTQKFHNAYEKICRDTNIPLAKPCGKHEKAFGPSTFGTVLGINFDSETMEWSISKEKEISLQETIDMFLYRKTCTLKQIQKLQGKLANFAQCMELMKSFKFNVLLLLNKFGGQEGVKIIPEELKRDLWVWKNAFQKAVMVCRFMGYWKNLPYSLLQSSQTLQGLLWNGLMGKVLTQHSLTTEG